MNVVRYDCGHCGVRYEGDFAVARLARLPEEMQLLAEQILLAGGNLKEVAARREISYPTLRKHVDALIEALEALRRSDKSAVDGLLQAVESGQVRPEYAARRIAEIHHGS